jgi:hypothetical protein
MLAVLSMVVVLPIHLNVNCPPCFAGTQLLLGVGEGCFENVADRLPRAAVELK